MTLSFVEAGGETQFVPRYFSDSLCLSLLSNNLRPEIFPMAAKQMTVSHPVKGLNGFSDIVRKEVSSTLPSRVHDNGQGDVGVILSNDC